jgi:GxxExxY protein
MTILNDIPVDDLNKITEKIINCAYTVSNTLGAGFLEKVYENALSHELRKRGLKAVQQAPMQVLYDEIIVGEYYADILVDDSILIELKAVKELDNNHRAQCLNYLKASRLHLCLLLNFGKPHIDIVRLVKGLDDNQPIKRKPVYLEKNQ